MYAPTNVRKYHVKIYILNITIIVTITDFSINGLSTENHLRLQRTPTPYKIKVNNSKLIDLEIRIELTRLILLPDSQIFCEIRPSISTCFYIRLSINFQGYQSFHSLRPINKREGGISIFIKDSIRAKHLYM